MPDYPSHNRSQHSVADLSYGLPLRVDVPFCCEFVACGCQENHRGWQLSVQRDKHHASPHRGDLILRHGLENFLIAFGPTNTDVAVAAEATTTTTTLTTTTATPTPTRTATTPHNNNNYNNNNNNNNNNHDINNNTNDNHNDNDNDNNNYNNNNKKYRSIVYSQER